MYDGRWTANCESWFIECAELIASGFVGSKTEGDWWNNLRHARRSTRLTDEQWANIEEEITTADGVSWEGTPLRDLFNLDDPENNFKEHDYIYNGNTNVPRAQKGGYVTNCYKRMSHEEVLHWETRAT